MNFMALFSRANIDVAKAAAREYSEVMADGQVTIKELIESSADLADAALTAYGVADEPVFVLDETGKEAADLAADIGEVVFNQIDTALEDGMLTAAELVGLVEDVSLAVAKRLTDHDAPLGEA